MEAGALQAAARPPHRRAGVIGLRRQGDNFMAAAERGAVLILTALLPWS